ncbi:MAG: IPT/TIG domain-containing protein [Mariniphaga sp.]|nr:IPT/TIG domain-containing protein [Mariniphaga sp.]
MKRSILFILAFLFVFFTNAQTIIEDSTDVQGTWVLANSPYLINGMATVPEGDSLVIEPGVTIEFKTGTDINHSGDNDTVNVGYIKVLGKLIAEGTPEQRITFTRQGDEGNWGCIVIVSLDNSNLEYCIIQYANRIDGFEGAINIYTPNTKLINSLVINNLNHGIFSEDSYWTNLSYNQSLSTPDIRNCVIAYNGGSGLILGYEYSGSTIKLINNTIVGNSSVGLATMGTKCLVINCIFWDNYKSFSLFNDRTTVSYSLVQEESLDGVGWLTVGEGIIYMSDPRENNDFSLPGNSPCINSGVPDTSGLSLPLTDILGNNRINLDRIDLGASESTAEKFITILKPNGHEGFQPGNNLDIIWKSNAVNVKLEYTSDGGETWEGIVSSTANDSLFSWVIPSVESENFNIRISDVADNTVFDICDNDLTVFTSTIPDSTILSGKLRLEHSPYLINGMVTVPFGDSLVIDPGVVLKFKAGDGIIEVKGILIAKGTHEQPITFTRQGTEGYWNCIYLSNKDANSVLEYCTIEYAGNWNGAIIIYNPNPKLTNLVIINNKYSGIYANESSPEIRNCIVAFNKREGIYLRGEHYGDTIKIINNTIVGNGDEGLWAYQSKCLVKNCILWGNAESFFISYNTLVSYSLVQEDVLPDFNGRLIIGEGLIYNLDPQFTDLNNLDFHLKPNSPGIDQGNPDSDFENEPEENGNRVNLGAYGNTVEATQTEYLPRITWLSEREGHMFGNDTLIIKGANFLAAKQNGKIRFDNTEAIEYLFWSNDSLVCITPPHLPDTVNIYIINNDLKEGYGFDCYTIKPPEIKNLSKVTGEISGGDTLAIEGEFFGFNREQVIIRFEEQSVNNYISWSDTLITFTTPANTPGLKQIIFEQDTLIFNSGASFIYTSESTVDLCGSLEDTLRANGVYIMTCKCDVDTGKTLTIEPGVFVIADHNQAENIRLTVNGTLNATGTPADSIRFMTMISGKNNWDGIYIADTANFNFVVVQNGEYGIYQSNGYSTFANSHFSENETGIHFYGRNERVYSYINNCRISNNTLGLRAEASGNKAYGLADIEVISSVITSNNGNGIELSGHGYMSSGWIPKSQSSNVYCTLKNSVIANNNGYAVYLHSQGFTFSAIPVGGSRRGYARIKSYNNIIYNNIRGIISQRVNKNPQTLINAEFYNTNIWNNNSVFEMDANEVFFYNSNLWDNNISGVPTGICDNLVFESCNLNDLSVVQNGSNNISSDPLYISSETGDFNLQSGSPCIDAGSNNSVDFITDFSGMSRIWDGDADGEWIVDIGAFEKDSQAPQAPEIIIQPQGGSYCQNSIAELSVSATGVPVPDYQWFYEGKIIEGAIEKEYIIESVNDTTAGLYSCLVTNLSGSENSSEAVIELLPSYELILYESICEGDTFILNEVKYMQAQEIIQSLTTVDGCDSTVTTFLTVNPTFEAEEFVSICEGEDYLGLTGEGEHRRKFETINGCDSIVVTHLTLNQTYGSEEYVSICEGEDYLGLIEEGEHRREFETINGCDSIVITHLTVNPAYSSDEYVTLCQGENYMEWNETGDYSRQLESVNGCDSIITTHLIVNPVYNFYGSLSICQPETFGGYSEPGQYDVELKTVNGCDSIIINLTIHPSFKPTISRVEYSTLASADDYKEYQWYFNGEPIEGATSKELVYTENGDYYLLATNENNCSYASESINTPAIRLEQFDFSYSIMPNPNKGEFNFRIDSNPPEKLTVKLINGLGQVMEVREIKYPAINQIEHFNVSHLSKGIYHFVIISDNFMEDLKIVVQ